jgi:hypothetical protein
MIKLDYLVAGTGRCGTVYMARLLTSLGINCLHEGVFGNEGLEVAKSILNGEKELDTSYCSKHDLLKDDEPIEDWINLSNIQAESSYMSVPFLNDEILKNTKIIHIVRNPLNVISSHIEDVHFFTNERIEYDPYAKFVCDCVPEIWEIENEIERACFYYVYWNGLIEKSKKENYFFHKVENNCNQNLLDFLNKKKPADVFSNKSINSWKKRKKNIELKEIPEGTIKNSFIEIVEKYEYRKNANAVFF